MNFPKEILVGKSQAINHDSWAYLYLLLIFWELGPRICTFVAKKWFHPEQIICTCNPLSKFIWRLQVLLRLTFTKLDWCGNGIDWIRFWWIDRLTVWQTVCHLGLSVSGGHWTWNKQMLFQILAVSSVAQSKLNLSLWRDFKLFPPSDEISPPIPRPSSNSSYPS